MPVHGHRKKNRCRPGRRQEGGAAAVEFALVLPILLAVVFGLIQYGLYFWSMQGGSAAAREAARRGAVGDLATCAAFETYIRARIAGTSTNEDDAVITRTYADYVTNAEHTGAGVLIGDVVTVYVQFESHDLNFPFVPFIDGGLVTQSADARVDYRPEVPEDCS